MSFLHKLAFWHVPDELPEEQLIKVRAADAAIEQHKAVVDRIERAADSINYQAMVKNHVRDRVAEALRTR